MNEREKIYEGKAKILYKGTEKNTAIQYFKDHATAFNNLKKSTIEGKGIFNNRISEHIFIKLNQIGIKTHFIKSLSEREQLVHMVEIIPLEFIVRNIATGSLTKRLGITDGTVLTKPLLEYSYKNDELGDPLVAREHIDEFNWASSDELDLISNQCLKINNFMQTMFKM
jgi:phosphoribosylaminoimidazole-succinocarboxamide synthase